MISRRSSGSSRVARAVEPTRSQNITVSCRRSAEDTGGGLALGSESGGGGGDEAATTSFRPHSEQNFAPGTFAWPHPEQRNGSAAPHWLQNLLPSGMSPPQLGH